MRLESGNPYGNADCAILGLMSRARAVRCRHAADGRALAHGPIRGLLRMHGLKVGEIHRNQFDKRVRELLKEMPTLNVAVEPLLRVLEQLVTERKAMDKLLGQAARKDKVCLRLMTIPLVSHPGAAAMPTPNRSTIPGKRPRNPLVANAVLRAFLVAMDKWVSAGTEPPASRLPRVADGTLVPPLPQTEQGFPAIPGVKYNGRMHTGDLLHYGP